MTRYLITLMLCLALPVSGVAGGAMRFDGVDDYIDTNSDNLSLDSANTFTVSSWFETSADYSGAHGMIINDYGTPGWRLFFNNDNDLCVTTHDGTDYKETYATGMNDGNWHHVVGIFNVASPDTQPILYVDGVQCTDVNNNGGDVDEFISASNVMIGKQSSTSTRYFNGSIDEVLIYNKSLTASEVQAMYASGGAWYPKDGLVSRWSMENNGVSTGQAHANGSTIKDSVGSNNGTVADGADSSMTLTSSPVREKRGRR